jgi:hypothetical protein
MIFEGTTYASQIPKEEIDRAQKEAIEKPENLDWV